MTNEEKAKEISKKYEDWWALEAPDVEKAAYDSVIDMAKWKKEQMIKKACEWLEYNFNMPSDFKEHFTKAMMEE